jgi:rubrerythrin
MAKKEDTAEHEPLTEEQRITALEEKVGTNKIVLISMALFLIVAVSVSATFLVVSIFTSEEAVGDSESLIALQTKVTELENAIEAMKKVTKSSRNELLVLKEKVTNSSNQTLQQILLEQERGHQTFLETLRSGMYDLAHMLPGSRTWLEVYSEKVDKAEIYSKDREKTLLKLQKGSAAKEADDDPFAEGF